MTELPVRLNAGDPVPEDCIAVPLHGPGKLEQISWHWLINQLRGNNLSRPAETITAIAVVADAPRQLRKGDRVEINGMVGTLDSVDYTDQTGVIRWEVEQAPRSIPVPFDALTRIDDPESSASPLRITHEDGASNVNMLRDEDNPEGAGGSQDPGPTPDWTPAEGMLVERISDEKCFRIRIRSPHKLGTFDLLPICNNEPPYMPFSLADVRVMFRPRYLRVGDVIEKVTGGVEDPSLIARCIGEPIVDIATCDYGTLLAHVRNGWVLSNARTIHIEGLGPVPWPPKEKL